MTEVTLVTFEEFESQAIVLLEDLKSKRVETGKHFSPALFRGQDKASWDLKTTLERYSRRQYSPEDYYEVMRSVRPTVESCTEKRWDFSDKYTHDDAYPNAPQSYDFMVYLRHHYFPSPPFRLDEIVLRCGLLRIPVCKS